MPRHWYSNIGKQPHIRTHCTATCEPCPPYLRRGKCIQLATKFVFISQRTWPGKVTLEFSVSHAHTFFNPQQNVIILAFCQFFHYCSFLTQFGPWKTKLAWTIELRCHGGHYLLFYEVHWWTSTILEIVSPSPFSLNEVTTNPAQVIRLYQEVPGSGRIIYLQSNISLDPGTS